MEYLLQKQKIKTEEKELKRSRESDAYSSQPFGRKGRQQTSVRYMEQSLVQKIKIPDNQIPVDISSRNNGPKWIGTINLGEDELTRHHIIPFKMIHVFLNLAMKEIENKSLSKSKINAWFLTALHTAKDTQENAGWDKFDSEIENERFSIIDDNEVLDDDNPISIEKLKLLEAAVSWMPGNIFIGPSYRLDDSKKEDEIDESAKYLIGESRYKMYQRTYDAMRSFIQDSSQQKELQSALEGLKRIAEQKVPYQYADMQEAWTKIESEDDVKKLEMLKGRNDSTVKKNLDTKRRILRDYALDPHKPNPNYYIPTEYIIDHIDGGTKILAALLQLQKGRVREWDDTAREIGTLYGKSVCAILKYQTITFYVEDVINGCRQIVRSNKREEIMQEIIDLAYAVKKDNAN